MRMLVVTPDSQYDIPYVNAGDMVWLVQNRTTLTKDKMVARFPHAICTTRSTGIRGIAPTGVIYAEEWSPTC